MTRKLATALTRSRKWLVAAALAAAALAAGAVGGPAWAHDSRPPALRGVDLEQRLGARLPLDQVFHDATGRETRLGALFDDRPVILTLVYYGCQDLCPLTLDGLVRSLRPLAFDIGREFDVITVSFDPRDTAALAAAKKRDFAGRYGRPGVEAGWHFLTGDANAIGALTRAAGFSYNAEAESGRFGHATGILLVTPEGRISRYFYGIEFSPRDLRLGLIEASAGKIGTAIDQLLLFCYHYDPVKGKYGLAITRAIRLGGLATVVVLGGFVSILLCRERRGHSRSGERA